MKHRGPDRQAPGKAAGLVGTVVVHAAAVSFLFTAVKPSKASPISYAVDIVARARGSKPTEGARSSAYAAAGGEAGAAKADAPQAGGAGREAGTSEAQAAEAGEAAAADPQAAGAHRT